MLHTPEPWIAEPIHARGYTEIYSEEHGPIDFKNEANARRIVAAVNACKGIPTEALEAGVVRELVEALTDRGEGRLFQYEVDQTAAVPLMRYAADYLEELSASDTSVRMLRDRANVLAAALSRARGEGS